jgi:hypothetical protein
MFVQIPSELIAYVRSLKLTGTQYDLWLYLYSLDPYGDRFVEIPPPKEIAEVLKVDYRTIERAAQRLVDCNLFEFQIERWKAKNRKAFSKTVLPVEQFTSEPAQEQGSKPFSDNSLGKEIQILPTGSKLQNLDLSDENGISLTKSNETSHLKPAQEGSSENEDVPIVLNTLLNKTNGSPTRHPVSTGQGETGTNAQIWEQLAAVNIAPNKTIQRVLGDLQNQQGAAAAAKAVENAISALQEQQRKRIIRNPGGFITAALRRGFTANQAKKEHRERSHSSPGSRSTSSPAAPSSSELATSNPPTQTQPKPQTRPPLDTHALLSSIYMATLHGDRQFALDRLQHYWLEGWQEEVEDLCITFKRDWGFIITAQGIQDGRG